MPRAQPVIRTDFDDMFVEQLDAVDGEAKDDSKDAAKEEEEAVAVDE
jgi:hypothetical protein